VAPRTRHALIVVSAMVVFAATSLLIFRGYLTPEMMVYFLTFKWCF
jgi:hypothetical protein